MRTVVFAAILVILVLSFTALACAETPKPAEAGVVLQGAITADGPIFNYITGKAYTLSLTITNPTASELKLDKFDVRLSEPGNAVLNVKTDGEAPKSAAAGKDAVAKFTITFPNETAGHLVMLAGKLEYSLKDQRQTASCEIPLMVTSPLEITLLPARAILDGKEESQRVGMSIINHTDTPFDGKITLTTSPGISVSPADIAGRIDAQGLEAYVFTVTPAKNAAPGHYAVFVDAAGKSKEWGAIDIPLFARKAKGIKVDGNLGDWKDAAQVNIVKATAGADGKWSYKNYGKAWFAYDDVNFYAAVEASDPEQKADVTGTGITIAFDPLMNGAASNTGGYKEDDFEAGAGSEFIQQKGCSCALGKSGKNAVCEIAVPWSRMKPLKPVKGTVLGAAVKADVGGVVVEWGGGISGNKDPRLFVPVILSD